jgi:thiamine biosynthesis lipoprotein
VSTATGEPATSEGAPPYAAAQWSALGTYVQLVVAGAERLDPARAEATRLIEAVDLACSRFRPDSDLVRANRAAGSWVDVHPLLAAALTVALEAADDTAGLVDPTLGRELEALGYDRDFAQLPVPGPATPRHRDDPDAAGGPAAVPHPVRPHSWREVEVDPRGRVRVPAGVVLDLGAVGKAFAADLVASSIARVAGADCVVSLGGDVAVGATPDSAGHPWQVAVAEGPADRPAQLVVLDRGGMATSTTTHRRWSHAGTTVHHLLDPRTGRPVERTWRTVSVAAASCVAANTASTAALVLGAQAPAWLAERGLPARLVGQDGAVTLLGGWPDGGVPAAAGEADA